MDEVARQAISKALCQLFQDKANPTVATSLKKCFDVFICRTLLTYLTTTTEHTRFLLIDPNCLERAVDF